MSKRSARINDIESEKAKIKSHTSGEFGLEWKFFGTFLVLDSPQLQGNEKIASFDMGMSCIQFFLSSK